uniref:Cystatin C n=1 Tax=Oryctolagus cuniculus TaxID=9986 RepID=A0A5F9CA48_RABIT
MGKKTNCSSTVNQGQFKDIASHSVDFSSIDDLLGLYKLSQIRENKGCILFTLSQQPNKPKQKLKNYRRTKNLGTLGITGGSYSEWYFIDEVDSVQSMNTCRLSKCVHVVVCVHVCVPVSVHVCVHVGMCDVCECVWVVCMCACVCLCVCVVSVCVGGCVSVHVFMLVSVCQCMGECVCVHVCMCGVSKSVGGVCVVSESVHVVCLCMCVCDVAWCVCMHRYIPVCACVVSVEGDVALGSLAAFANGCSSPPVCCAGSMALGVCGGEAGAWQVLSGRGGHWQLQGRAGEAGSSAQARACPWALGPSGCGARVECRVPAGQHLSWPGKRDRNKASAKGSELSGQEGSGAPRDDSGGAIVSGVKYYLDVLIGRTTCTKTQTNLANCPFHDQPDLQRKMLCSFEIYSVPWLNKISLLKSDCQNA